MEDKNDAEIISKKILSDEIGRLGSEINKVENNVLDLIGGGTTLQVVGVFYFVIGLFLASASLELSKAIQAVN